MKIIFQYVIVILIFIVLISCKDEKATEPEGGFVPDELVGTWNATKIEFLNQDIPAQVLDVYIIGARQSILVSANGRFTTTFNFPFQPQETESGVINVEGNLAVLDPDGDAPSDTVTFTLDVDTLIVVDTDQEFDFDGDDVDSPATLTLTYLRS